MTKLLEWSFDEASGVALDHSGNGRDLTLNGNAVRTADGGGHAGRGLTQSSAGSTVGPDVNAFETPIRTWMCWLKVNGAANCWAMEFYRSAADTGVMGLLLLNGNLHFRVKNPSNTVFSSDSIPQDSGNWHHIAATYDGTSLRTYRDGALLGSPVTVTGGLWDADVLRVLDASGSVFTIDDVRLFDTALSATDIQTFMNTPAGPTDVNEGTLTGSFSAPAAEVAGTATAVGVIEGSFSAPIRSLFGTASASGSLAGSFSDPTMDADGVASAGGALSGSFSQPTFTGTGGEPMPDRDILVTIGPGERPVTLIEPGAARTQIGESRMDTQWRNGSKQFIDFVMTLTDPEGELTLAELQAVPFTVAVTRSSATPARDAADWVSPSVAKEVVTSGTEFKVSILHLYTAVEKGMHNVWVKFGPTPEEPIYLAVRFVVL